MKKLFRDCKAAVTVFVTLLLIPAIMVTGSGVDLARIYTARSIIQDANQLAANSTLASYDALLQDLYGLYGVMLDNPEIGSAIDECIHTAIEGKLKNTSGGTFALFHGSDIEPGEPVAESWKNLGNTSVLSRQIEDYSKFRAPAIVAEELMDKLDVFEKVQEDARVIKKKLEVDDGVEELEKCYKEIYDLLQDLHDCREDEIDAMQTVSDYGADIQTEFEALALARREYKQTKEKYDLAQKLSQTAATDEERAAAEAEMKEYEDDLRKLQEGYTLTCLSIQSNSSELNDKCEDYEKELRKYQDMLDELLTKGKKANDKKEELKEKIEQLRTSLESGKCSNELQQGLTAPEIDENGNEIDGMSTLDRYDALLKYDVEQMAEDMWQADYDQIERTIEERMKKAALADEILIELRGIDVEAKYPITGEASELNAIIAASTTFKPDPGRDGTGFLFFDEISEENRKFYNELKEIYKDGKKNGADRKTLKKSVTKIFKQAQESFGALTYEPEGAKYLKNVSSGAGTTGTNFGSEGDWSSEDAGKDKLEQALDADFLSKLSNTADKAASKMLLLVYDTEMFSNAATPGSQKPGYPEENMAGIPLSTDVNYYFQSELEYLYNGNLADAEANLRSVAGMIFLVRFIFDYVASFSISEVNGIVRAVKAALSWTGPFAILAGELARLGLSVGEAAIDVARLRDGEDVVIYKTNSTWRLSIGGLVNAAKEEISDDAISSAFSAGKKGGGDSGVTMGYKDYIRLFLLLVPADTLSYRTRKLIELNVTNYKQDINADEETMSAAELFDLSAAVTDFSLTTTVELNMLFLSMPFAQEGINGVTPPGTMTISATDYRGY